ncbi:MAG: hypothetical protein J1D87_06895 [Lachnospiraceae bacterium]|nr:hypothetical protein [Lachnospiraceae bacterium]
MGKYKICQCCHIAFDKRLNECPSCGRTVVDENEKSYLNKEGNGRKYGAGGDACDYCPHCYGNANWCPIMDND